MIKNMDGANQSFLVIVGTTCISVVVAMGLFQKRRVRQRVMDKIYQKQLECKQAFDVVEKQLESSNLSAEEVSRIVNLSFTELHQQLQEGALKAITVLNAYQIHALKSNKSINAITEPLTSAKQIAEDLDRHEGKKGLLHGIPVSLKECYDIKGLDSTAGLSRYIGHPSPDNAALVKVLLELGAVPFVRTNLPQTMMTLECSNPLFGGTCNPVDLTRGPGGSSGGEGALIGAGASILGFGTDIGGSIRLPSHLSGCYGLKPSTDRFSKKGIIAMFGGQTLISSCVGPMSRDLEGLVSGTRALLSDYHFKLDPGVLPLKFRDELYNSTGPLRIGFYVTDGYIPAVPACHRAVMLSKAALEAMGHTVVDFVPPRAMYAFTDLYVRSVAGDRWTKLISMLKHDIVDPTIKRTIQPAEIPKCALWLLSWILQVLTKDVILGRILRSRMGVGSVPDWFDHAIKLQEYREEFLAAWTSQRLDAVICPTFAMPAVKRGKAQDVMFSASYCMLYNVLNYTAGVLPVTKVTADDVAQLDNYPSHTKTLKTVKEYNFDTEGLPVGVQCVSLPYHEEIVLRVMREIQTGLKNL